MNKFGNWLKLGDNQWIPITKRFSENGPFLPVLKIIKKLALPRAFNLYWNMQPMDCSNILKSTEKRKCNFFNSVRYEVLRIMVSNKFVKPKDFSLEEDVDVEEETVSEEQVITIKTMRIYDTLLPST